MGNMGDALKKAGLGAEEGAEAQAAAAEGGADTGEHPAEASTAPAAEPSAAEPAAEPAAQAAEPAPEPKEQPCAQCGTPFMAKHPRHRLCDKCAAERQSTRPAKPAPRPDAKPASADRGPAPTGETRACAKCGTAFSPRHPRHRMCDKCAAEAPPREAREPRPPRESRPPAEARPNRESRPVAEVPRTPAQPVARPVRREPPVAVRRAPSAGVPQDYLAGGYFGGSRTQLRDELYLDWAQQWAELLVQRRLSSAQMRAFYNHVRRAAASLQAGGDAQQARAQLLRIPGFAAARVGRPGFPLEFREFLDRNVEQVKDAATLQAFAEHFQAVVGFTSGRLRN